MFKWIKLASLKRDRMQAVTMTISSLVIFSSFFFFLSFPDLNAEIITFSGTMIFIIICNHYANQYNSFSFNITNLAEYVYTAVKLPVLILDVSGDIMLCNASSESFFRKSADELSKLRLFDLFNFGNGFSSLELHKKDANVFNYDAISLVGEQKCQISINYIYDKYDEMICTVVIVTDITEKEDLIKQLNESKAIIEKYNRELQVEVDRQTVNIRNLQEAIVYSMSDLIEKKDGYTGGHTRRVSGYVSIMLGELARRGFSLTEPEIKRAAESSLLHDMGKIAIPDSILLKNGKLTADEFDVMKSHSSAGADSLHKSMQFAKDNKFLENAFAMAKHHHEKWNGGGYPDGKKGQDIPFLARVTAIADVYDALRSERPYKEPFSREKARTIILEENGRQFDPDLVDVFLAVEPEFNAICESYVNEIQLRSEEEKKFP
jgi:response regulator RpfG family c-di-GMP phosphodiesterase